MDPAIFLIGLVVAVIGVAVYFSRQRAAAQQRALEDAKADARRLVERLGGQVLNLNGTDTASQQAMADASERYNAAGSQLEQARTVEQARLVKETALEGLYYVRAARTAMGLDPGPKLPEEIERERAGKVTEHRNVEVEGRQFEASPDPGQNTPYYYPGGRVAGRPVPQGWYSEPWWKPALVAGAWGRGSALLFSAMFSGMSGIAYADGFSDGAAAADGGFDGGGFDGGDAQGDVGADMGDPGGVDGG